MVAVTVFLLATLLVVFAGDLTEDLASVAGVFLFGLGAAFGVSGAVNDSGSACPVLNTYFASPAAKLVFIGANTLSTQQDSTLS